MKELILRAVNDPDTWNGKLWGGDRGGCFGISGRYGRRRRQKRLKRHRTGNPHHTS